MRWVSRSLGSKISHNKVPKWDGRGELYDWLVDAGAKPRRTSKGYSIRCLNPDHDDHNNSAQLFEDGWWCCYACGARHHIAKNSNVGTFKTAVKEERRSVNAEDYSDHYDYWLTLEPLKEGIKGIPASFLNQLGWRQFPQDNPYSLPAGIFIPYFNTKRSKVPFFQIRHESKERRFSFVSGCTPITNGLENLASFKNFLPIVEGTSDRAVLEFVGIPCLALPSGSSYKTLREIEDYARANNLILVACSDRDRVGDELLTHLKGSCIDLRPLPPRKDYGEVYEAGGTQPIIDRLKLLLPPKPEIKEITPEEFKEQNKTAYEILFQ